MTRANLLLLIIIVKLVLKWHELILNWGAHNRKKKSNLRNTLKLGDLLKYSTEPAYNCKYVFVQNQRTYPLLAGEQ